MAAQGDTSYLTYKSVDIYFIFSFAFDFLARHEEIADRLLSPDVAWAEGLPPDRKGRPPFLTIKRQRRGGKEGSYLSTIMCKKLVEEPAALVYTEAGSDEGPDFSNGFNVTVVAWGQLFDNGAGAITFQVELTEDVNFRKVYETHSLSQRMYDKAETFAKLKTTRGEESLSGVFHRLVSDLEKEINQDGTRRLVSLQDREVMDFGDREVEAQNPYVLTVVELDEPGSLSLFNHDQSVASLRSKEQAAILYRLVYSPDFFSDLRSNLANVKIPEELLAGDGHLRNYAWDERVLMCFAKTSSLLVTYDKKKIPTSLIQNSLLHILEIIRTRWHMSLLINAQLDQVLECFRATASGENLNVLERLTELRKRFAAFLNDPLPYAFEGGSASKIAEVAATEMQLANLRTMTIEKLATLDQLHVDQMKLVRLREFDITTKLLEKSDR